MATVADQQPPPTPITILTGFLGSGKTTLILNLLPQLPKDYKLALLKNEFGDVAVDSQLAGAQSIEGVRELTNGCICCNLVGQLGDALEALRTGARPDEDSSNNNASKKAGAEKPASSTSSPAQAAVDRIVIETSGSAFPATLAMEVNRLTAEGGGYTLDGVVSVVDAENWAGYEDTSVTAALQARYTDLIIVNKWEEVSERRLDEVVDRIRDIDIDPPVPIVKSDRGKVGADVVLGVDGALARKMGDGANGHAHEHEHDHEHSKEVEVLSVTVAPHDKGLDMSALEGLLKATPKDEVYRIKGIVYATTSPKSSDGKDAVASLEAPSNGTHGVLSKYILNWAFGRWTYTHMGAGEPGQPTARITIVTAPYESNKWKTQIEAGKYVRAVDVADTSLLQVKQVS